MPDHPSASLSPETRNTITSWAVRELAPWRTRGLKRAHAERRFARLNDRSFVMFLLRIARGEVTILPKPNYVDHPNYDHLLHRATHYRDHVQQVVDVCCPDLDVTLCAAMGDAARDDALVPTFAFQKPAPSHTVLLPDIDMLGSNFFEADQYLDGHAYEQKRIRAFFIGSLTGGIVTAETVATLAMPRLEAASSFHNDPDVEFRVPIRGQIKSDEVAAMLAKLPFCGGDWAYLSEQQENRFLISMDGNGATCSRVAITLKGNSVLLKYASPHVLYYFGGLAPWTHFIPITSHDDVRGIVALERASPGICAPIAANGRHFAETFLTRESVMFYTASLLSLYADCFSDGATHKTAPPAPDAVPRDRARTVTAHVMTHGDITTAAHEWAGLPGSRCWIEGFSMAAHTTEALEYCAVLADGTLSPWRRAGTFCGTRGRSQPIFGICLRWAGNAEPPPALRCEARFVDGSVAETLDPGQPCIAPTNSPLETFRITLKPGSA